MVVMKPRARRVVLVVVLALAASLLTLAVVLAKPAQAQAQTTTDTYRSTFNFSTGSCTGELVFLEGTEQIFAHTTIDANGVYHAKFQYKLQGLGEGLDSGDKYVFDDVNNFDQGNYPLTVGNGMI